MYHMTFQMNKKHHQVYVSFHVSLQLRAIPWNVNISSHILVVPWPFMLFTCHTTMPTLHPTFILLLRHICTQFPNMCRYMLSCKPIAWLLHGTQTKIFNITRWNTVQCIANIKHKDWIELFYHNTHCELFYHNTHCHSLILKYNSSKNQPDLEIVWNNN